LAAAPGFEFLTSNTEGMVGEVQRRATPPIGLKVRGVQVHVNLTKAR